MGVNKSDEALQQRLSELNISYRTIAHAPLYTVAESQALRGDLQGVHIKNLFLRDKKKNLWLLTAEENRAIDLKALRHVIGSNGNLSFGNAELLKKKMGVTPGSVSPFCVINDPEGEVKMILDQGLTGNKIINAHPLRNDRTTALSACDLLKFLKAENHDPLLIDFSRPLTSKEAS